MDKFNALAEPTRRKILEMLANDGEMTATEICEKFQVSAPAISQHLKVLREADLVSMEKRAQQRIYRVIPGAMFELEDWARHLTIVMKERFDALDALLEQEKKKLAEAEQENGK